MTSTPFGRGAIDLSSLATPKSSGGSFVVEIDERNFDAIVRQSSQFPIVVEFYSPRAPEQAALSEALAALAAEGQGRWLLGRVNVDTSRQVAAAFQIQAVPTVIGVLAGQLAPLWQGTLSKVEAGAYIDELLKVAAANGVIGRAQPQAPAPGQAAEAPAADARFAAADEALERGDYDAAVAEFDKVLTQTPHDAEAIAGRAQARLLARTVNLDPATIAAALQSDPPDLDAVFQAADLEVASGQPELGFERLLEVVRQRPADRERARVRLLELFETVGNHDPAVVAARRALMSALF